MILRCARYDPAVDTWHPAELKRRAGEVEKVTWIMNKIDPSRVPNALRIAIPWVEKWGMPEEGQTLELAEQASDADLQEFLTVFDSLDIQVLNTWLEIPDIQIVTEEQSAFMFFVLAASAVEQEIARRNPNREDTR